MSFVSDRNSFTEEEGQVEHEDTAELCSRNWKLHKQVTLNKGKIIFPQSATFVGDNFQPAESRLMTRS